MLPFEVTADDEWELNKKPASEGGFSFDGGRTKVRTWDPYDVNIVLYH